MSLRPHDVAAYAERLLHDLPVLRGQLSAALGAGERAVARSSPAAAQVLRSSGRELQQAVSGLDTSMGRLASALQAAAQDLILQDVAMWGRPVGGVQFPGSAVVGGVPDGGAG